MRATNAQKTAHLRKCAVSTGPLLFAFITYVHLEDVDAQPTLVFIACANNKNSNESAQSRYIHNIWKTQTQSRRRFFLQKLRRLRICAGWAESLSYSVHFIDLDTQSTLVFLTYASSRSADECVHMCSLARAFSTCVWNKGTFWKASRPNMSSKYGPWREKTWFCCMRTTKAQTSLRIWSASLIFALWKL